MAQFLQTNGDYTIKTAEGGIIKLDVGPPSALGRVIITSDLVIEGNTLTVDAENLNVKDNIIQLNFGETGAGVTLRYSGLQIDRGTEPAASLFYDENDDSFNIARGTPASSFNFDNSTLKVRKIITDTSAQDLLFLGASNPDAVLTVIGTTTYESNVTHDDDIPNKKYVDDRIRDNPTFQIIESDTRVIVTDSAQADPLAGSLAYLEALGGGGLYTTDDTASSAVSVIVDGTLVAQFYENRLEIANLEIGGSETGTEISTKHGISNENIFIRTQGTGRLQTNYAIELERIAGTPGSVATASTLYSNTPSTGNSGVFVVNSTGTTLEAPAAVNLDSPDYGANELINKNRALLYSMIF
jgi:hypothetical protein